MFPTVSSVVRAIAGAERVVEVSTLPYRETCLFWLPPGLTRERSHVVDTSGVSHRRMTERVRAGEFDKLILAVEQGTLYD